MSKLSAKDLFAIKDTIKRGEEVCFHLIYSRSGMTTTCRLWHPDGHVLGSAYGGGYDKAGAALGQAIEALFAEELKALKPGYVHPADKGPGQKVEDGLYGLTKHFDGHMSLDSSCGMECMLAVLVALGFGDTAKYATSKLSVMVIARR
jgi:hypothetical protein